ncbi:hypothetical protein ACQH7H_24405, partial [Escherichia coli]|uniref:hypothetical protein n=1 Tax=Escherichia coli TaxID=562 RepID=UPI003CFB1E02
PNVRIDFEETLGGKHMEQKVTKIALMGKMRSGKDTVGHYLNGTKGFGQFAFGTGIKRVVEILYPDLDLRSKPRKLYQDVGQRLREVDPLIWINYLDREVKRYSRSLAVIDQVPNVVITDVRQLNEAEFLKLQGYVLVRIYISPYRTVRRHRAVLGVRLLKK